MTKQKTHKSTKKRFRLTATGKVKHRKCGTSHLAISKPAKKIRQLRGTRVLEPSMTRAIVDALRGNSYYRPFPSTKPLGINNRASFPSGRREVCSRAERPIAVT